MLLDVFGKVIRMELRKEWLICKPKMWKQIQSEILSHTRLYFQIQARDKLEKDFK